MKQGLARAGLSLLVVMAVGLYLAVAMSACMATGRDAGPDAEPVPTRPDPPAPEPHAALPTPTFGVTINLWHVRDPDRLTDAIDRVADLGFNTLQVVTPVFQRDGAAPAVERVVGPHHGPTDEAIALALTHAKRRGLATALMMQVNFTRPRGNEWRGKLLPPDWPAWWAAYRDRLVEFAELAAEHDADALSVGCELLTTQQPRHAEPWRETIALARQAFPGTLYYSTNWDAYASFPAWRALDLVGISGYWDLTAAAADPDVATDDEVLARWADIQRNLAAFADRLDRPLLVTEVGYPALPWALRDPWNYLLGDASLDAAAPARAYRLLARAWLPRLTARRSAAPGPADFPTLLGLVLYEWDLYHDPATHTGYALDRPGTLDALGPLFEAVTPDTP